ncbi:MAG TPA: hypothetical protein DHV85_25315 [Candidatus Accumulibacter sp.]|nr:hypothetical protein [Accumulibacter sp.]
MGSSTLLNFAGPTGKEQAPIQPLSGGMKRRPRLARTLIDEPTPGLDPHGRYVIRDHLKERTG